MKRFTILMIVAVSIVLIAPPAQSQDISAAGGESVVGGFVAGEAIIATQWEQLLVTGLELISAAGISMHSKRQICFGYDIIGGDTEALDAAAAAFEDRARELGFHTYRTTSTANYHIIAFSKMGTHNNLVSGVNELCTAVGSAPCPNPDQSSCQR